MTKVYSNKSLTANIRLFKTVKISFCEVVFGSPSKRCEGSGLCKIYTITGAKRLTPNPRRIPVILFVNSSGRFGFRLNLGEISAVLKQDVFKDDVFTLEEEFVLPKYFARKLTIPQCIIPPGKYPIKQQGVWIQVVF